MSEGARVPVGHRVVVKAKRSVCSWQALVLAYETDTDGYWAVVRPLNMGSNWTTQPVRVLVGYLEPVPRAEPVLRLVDGGGGC